MLFKNKGWLISSLRIIIGIFFVTTGILKLRLPPEEVEALIRTFQILPHGLTYPFALILPWIEIIPGLLLIIGVMPFYSIGVIISLTTIFVIALISVIIRGIPVEDCGCLGGILQETPLTALWRDIGIILLSIPVARTYYKR